MALPAVKVTRRDPGQVKAHGALTSRLYCNKVKEICRLHYLAQWEMAEKIVDECRQSGDQELYIAVMFWGMSLVSRRILSRAQLQKHTSC